MEREEKRLLDNGIELYSYKNPYVNSFYISLFVRAGSMYESEDESGITHFLEHVAIRNVNVLMDGGLYPLLDRYGIEFNAATYSEMVQFYVSGAKANFAIGAQILSKLMSPIVLSRSEIDTERDRIKAEIRESDERGSLAGFTSRAVHEGTTLARPITGTAGSVNKIGRKKLEEYRVRAFSRGNLFLYVTGCFSDSDLDCLAALFGKASVSEGEMRGNFAPVPKGFGKRAPTVHLKNADFTMIWICQGSVWRSRIFFMTCFSEATIPVSLSSSAKDEEYSTTFPERRSVTEISVRCPSTSRYAPEQLPRR